MLATRHDTGSRTAVGDGSGSYELAWRTTAHVCVSFAQAIRHDSARQDVPAGTVAAMVMHTAAPPRYATARHPERPSLGDYISGIGANMDLPFHVWQSL